MFLRRRSPLLRGSAAEIGRTRRGSREVPTWLPAVWPSSRSRTHLKSPCGTKQSPPIQGRQLWRWTGRSGNLAHALTRLRAALDSPCTSRSWCDIRGCYVSKVVVLHLSDLHFGAEPTPRISTHAIAARSIAISKLLDTLAAMPPDWRSQIVAVTGDIGWAGKPANYRTATKWLRGLLDSLGLDAEALVMCPGNHDVDRDLAVGSPPPASWQDADKWLDPPHMHLFLRPFKALASFGARLDIPTMQLGSLTTRFVGGRALQGLWFVSVNSAWFSRDDSDRGKLWIGLPQLKVMSDAGQFPADTGYDRAPLTVALIHHPITEVHSAEAYSIPDRVAAYRYLASRCHVVLAGHSHCQPTVPDRMANAAYCFLGGATYEGPNFHNAFSLLRFDLAARSVERRPFVWAPGDDAWQEKDLDEDGYSLLAVKKARRTMLGGAAAMTSLAPAIVESRRPKQVCIAAILHISDLHCREKKDTQELLEATQKGLRGLLAKQHAPSPDFLVVSGDTAYAGRKVEFELGTEFLRQVCAYWKIPPSRTLIAPGNHDCEWRGGRGQPVRGQASFSGFASELFEPLVGVAYPLDPQLQAYVMSDLPRGVQMLALNSAWECSREFPDRASINTEALESGVMALERQAAGFLPNARDGASVDEQLRIAVWHHPPAGERGLLSAGALSILSNHGFRVLLHGHMHIDRGPSPVYFHATGLLATSGGGLAAFGTSPSDTPRPGYELLVFSRSCSDGADLQLTRLLVQLDRATHRLELQESVLPVTPDWRKRHQYYTSAW